MCIKLNDSLDGALAGTKCMSYFVANLQQNKKTRQIKFGCNWQPGKRLAAQLEEPTGVLWRIYLV